MLLPPSGLTSAAAAVVAEAVAVVVLRCPPPGLSRANWSRRWWLRHPRQSSQYWPSISYSRHTFLNWSLKQTHNIFSEFWSLKREYIRLDWSFDNIGELCSTFISPDQHSLCYHNSQVPDISVFRLRAGAAEFPHNFSDERMSPAASHHTWEYQQRRDNFGRHPSCHLSALHDVTD